MAVNPADPGASRPLEGIRRPASDQAALERQAPRACDPALRSSAGQHTGTLLSTNTPLMPLPVVFGVL